MKNLGSNTMRISVSALLTGTLAALVLNPAVLAGEGKAEKKDSAKTAVTKCAPTSCMSVMKVEGNGNGVAWFDLASIIEDAKGGIKVVQTLPLPENIPVAGSLEVGSLIKTFQGKPVTTAEELMAQYDKLKAGDTVTVAYELKGKTETIKFAKVKRAGNLMMIKK